MVKRLTQKLANRLGYKIERIRPQVGRSIDVLGLIVANRFADRGRDVTLVQIGAHDGRSNDPVRRFISRHHWRGLLVEPQPNVFARLVKGYGDEPQLAFENAAITDSDGVVTFYRFRDDPSVPESASQLASLDPKILLRHPLKIPNAANLIEAIEVPSMRLSTLLKKHGIESLDLLVIDAEGYDAQILKTIDFSTVRPTIVYFEDRNLSPDDELESRRLLDAQGYQLCSLDGDTIAYLNENGN